MDQAVLDIFAKYDAGYDVLGRLKRLVGDEEGKAGEVLWQAHRGGHHDCTTEQCYWSAMADATEAYDASDVANLLTTVAAHPTMQGLNTSWRDDNGWVIYFTSMVKAVQDKQPLVEAWKTVPEPMKSNLGFQLARGGALTADDLGADTLAQIASQYASGTNWGLGPFDEVWPGEMGAAAMAVAVALPDTEIWDAEVVVRSLPAATPEQLAHAVYNLDYGSTLPKVAACLDPVPDGLADALLAVDRSHASDHGAHLALIVLARAGRGADADAIIAEALEKDPEKDFADLLTEALRTLPQELVVPHVAARFTGNQRSRERWSLVPAVPVPAVLTAAIDVVKGWPRGEPWERDPALAAFQRLPAEARPVMAEVSLGKLPQRDILAWGMASSGAHDALLPLLGDTSGKVVEAAVHGLGAVEALPQLAEALAHKKKAFRLGGARALALLPASPERQALAEQTLSKEKNAEVKAILEPLVAGERAEVLHLDTVREALATWDPWSQLEALGAEIEPALQAVLAEGKARHNERAWSWYVERGWPGLPAFATAQLQGSVASARRGARDALVALGAGEQVLPLLAAKKATIRTDAATILRQGPQEGFVHALTSALAKEKSKPARAAMAEALEACVSLADPPLRDVPATAAGHAALDARFARWLGDAPIELDGLELTWASGAPVSDKALVGLFAALDRGQDLTGLRAHVEEHGASALWHELGRRLEGTKEGRYGWGVAATGVLAREADLADYGRPLDDMARGGEHNEAFARLSALARHGSSAALQWVDHWARKARSNGLRERAGTLMDEAAAILGLSRDELAERVFPDFGLDARGERPLDYGEKSYVLCLNAELKLEIREGGKVRKTLPKPKTDEDKRLRTDLTALRKQLRSAVAAAVDRLEAAMVEGRAWTPSAWAEVFGNPVHRRLAEQLVWWDVGARQAFRVAEDGSFADRDDEAFDRTGPFTLAHPLRLDDAEAWAEVLVDYERMPPFPQLVRPTVAPTAPDADAIDDWMVHPVASTRLRGFMGKQRWVRGDPQDGGAVLWMSKPFRTAGVTAILDFEPGLGMGYDYEDEQTLRDLVFVSGIHTEGYGKPRLRLGDVDPVVYAEVVGSIQAMVEAERASS